MVISISALKGFLLEEALVKLLENSGYSLITKDVLDNPELYGICFTRKWIEY